LPGGQRQSVAVLFISNDVQVVDHAGVLSRVAVDVSKEQADFDQISSMMMEGKAVKRLVLIFIVSAKI
jgi:hypothetical protein